MSKQYTVMILASEETRDDINIPGIVFDDSGKEPFLTDKKEEAEEFKQRLIEWFPYVTYGIFELVEVK